MTREAGASPGDASGTHISGHSIDSTNPVDTSVMGTVDDNTPLAEFRFPRNPGLVDSEAKATGPLTTQAFEQGFNQAKKLWPEVSSQSVRNALDSKFADGDPARAVTLLQFYWDAVAGYVTSVGTRQGQLLPLRGATNYHGVSCYLDSLLTAMFSRMENFEPLLYSQKYPDRPTEVLAVWLRLFVNLLRNGELITADIVQGLMAACCNAGWASESMNAPLQQQDAAELFAFITERLRMPLLALKVDIAHAGKEVAEDDHKLVQEQLLYLPVPGTAADPPILLEECLEVYFSNAVSVSRHLDPSPSGNNTPGVLGDAFTGEPPSMFPPPAQSMPVRSPSQFSRRRSYSIVSMTTPSVVSTRRFPPTPGTTYFDGEEDSWPTPPAVGKSEESLLFGSNNSSTSSPAPHPQSSKQGQPIARQTNDMPDSEAGLGDIGSLPSYTQLFGSAKLDSQAEARARDLKRSLWTSDNEIMLPAWMFLQLMPFYAADTSRGGPLNNLEADEVASHFSKTRPVLGFCLKRYMFDEHGHPQRNGRQVVIPETITLPSFVADDSDRDQAFGNFKLMLESAIFHSGKNVHSGHYTALIGESPRRRKLSTATPFQDQKPFSWLRKGPTQDDLQVPTTSSGDSVEKHDGSSRRWLLCDDMAPAGEKIKAVDFNEVFQTQCPYMLFYRMMSLDEQSGTESVGSISRPPSPLPVHNHQNQNDTLNPNPQSQYSMHTPGHSPILSPVQNPTLNLALNPSLSQPQYSNQRQSQSILPDKKKRRPKFLRRHQKDYASTYREEKCLVM